MYPQQKSDSINWEAERWKERFNLLLVSYQDAIARMPPKPVKIEMSKEEFLIIRTKKVTPIVELMVKPMIKRLLKTWRWKMVIREFLLDAAIKGNATSLTGLDFIKQPPKTES